MIRRKSNPLRSNALQGIRSSVAIRERTDPSSVDQPSYVAINLHEKNTNGERCWLRFVYRYRYMVSSWQFVTRTDQKSQGKDKDAEKDYDDRELPDVWENVYSVRSSSVRVYPIFILWQTHDERHVLVRPPTVTYSVSKKV